MQRTRSGRARRQSLLHALQHEAELGGLKGLRQIVTSSQAHGLHHGIEGPIRGENGNLNARGCGLPLRKQSVSKHIGKLGIEQDEVGWRFRKIAQCSVAGTGFGRLECQGRCDRHTNSADAEVAIDDEQSKRERSAHCGSPMT